MIINKDQSRTLNNNDVTDSRTIKIIIQHNHGRWDIHLHLHLHLLWHPKKINVADGKYASTISRWKEKCIFEKHMITVFWSTNGMKSISALPRGSTFTFTFTFTKQTFFQSDCLERFDRFVKTHSTNKIHLWTCSSHWQHQPHLVDDYLENCLNRLNHPPSSSDLAPIDFFLFGYLTIVIEGKEFERDEELLIEVNFVLRWNTHDTLLRVYEEWNELLRKCISMNGEYDG
jgi:hypothetical protein